MTWADTARRWSFVTLGTLAGLLAAAVAGAGGAAVASPPPPSAARETPAGAREPAPAVSRDAGTGGHESATAGAREAGTGPQQPAPAASHDAGTGAAPGAADPANPDSERPEPRPSGDDDDIRETIALLFMVRMKNEVGLSRSQYELILPKVDERERAKKTAFEERRAHGARLRELIARRAGDADLNAEIERMLAVDAADQRSEDAFVSDLRKVLSPRQQAQFLLFRTRFRLWLDNRMREARDLQRPRLGRRLGVMPGSRLPRHGQDSPRGED